MIALCKRECFFSVAAFKTFQNTLGVAVALSELCLLILNYGAKFGQTARCIFRDLFKNALCPALDFLVAEYRRRFYVGDCLLLRGFVKDKVGQRGKVKQEQMYKFYVLGEYSRSRVRVYVEHAQFKVINSLFKQCVKTVSSSRLYSYGVIQLRRRFQVAAVYVARDAYDIAAQVGVVENRREGVPVAKLRLAAVRYTTSHAY